MITIEKWLSRTTKLFAHSGIDSARLDAELILCSALRKSREYLIAHSDEMVADDFAKDLVERRINREPLAYITGEKEFYGRIFAVTPDVLIPRPESEHIIESVRKVAKNDAKILDVGTGSGALAITAALEFPHTKVFAADISDAALGVAKQNAANLDAEIAFLRSDLLKNIDGKFDVIVANLPYVAKTWDVSLETRSEPDLALFANDDGLELIKKFIVQAPTKLSRHGFLILEMDIRQIETVSDFAIEHDFIICEKLPFTLTLQRNHATAPRIQPM